jgi:hypothetical protein
MVTILGFRLMPDWGARGGGGGGVGAMVFPQLAQNFTPWRTGFPQWGHANPGAGVGEGRGVGVGAAAGGGVAGGGVAAAGGGAGVALTILKPQDPQNLLPGRIGFPHFGQLFAIEPLLSH